MFPQSAATIVGVYREFAPPPDLAAHVACVWTSVSRGGAIFPGRLRRHRLARRPAGRRRAGARARSRPTSRSARAVFGVRFRLGVAGAALGLPAGEFLDDNVPVADLWGPASTSAWPCGGPAALVAAVRERVRRAPLDPLARAAALAMAVPGARVRTLSIWA